MISLLFLVAALLLITSLGIHAERRAEAREVVAAAEEILRRAYRRYGPGGGAR